MKTVLIIGAILEWSLFMMAPAVEAKPVRHGPPHQFAAYELNHYTFHTVGKAFIVKECPTTYEWTCIMTWGRI